VDPNPQEDEAVADEAPPWRRGRAGTAIGCVVHAVLQSIDIHSIVHVEGMARAQALAVRISSRLLTVPIDRLIGQQIYG
jgi:hypothetical protein